ncbi:GNAT family N-acetyltransferase [Leptospira levettii]|uniref:GNAT family N-acetyltransferase n=1 Tax=Leptospira levettii TaxID=2023178 RepID=UPI00223CA671|nr:GNAT family N-acetyltransferase [Leptospira levettii]MCW7474078.1 GNAT family N-acetyltransferase [Leptospira levettii]
MLPVETKKLSAYELKEFIELICVFADVFEMKEFQMPNESYLQSLLSRDDFFVFVTLIDGKVIAGLTAYLLRQYYSERPLVYIFDLAVQTKWQRKGIGNTLIRNINEYCRKEGMEEVFVQADVADEYALDFYRSTGGLPEEVIHFTYPLN